jgi:hypothetical protein
MVPLHKHIVLKFLICQYKYILTNDAQELMLHKFEFKPDATNRVRTDFLGAGACRFGLPIIQKYFFLHQGLNQDL